MILIQILDKSCGEKSAELCGFSSLASAKSQAGAISFYQSQHSIPHEYLRRSIKRRVCKPSKSFEIFLAATAFFRKVFHF